jgi:hypothetical protein
MQRRWFEPGPPIKVAAHESTRQPSPGFDAITIWTLAISFVVFSLAAYFVPPPKLYELHEQGYLSHRTLAGTIGKGTN